MIGHWAFWAGSSIDASGTGNMAIALATGKAWLQAINKCSTSITLMTVVMKAKE